MTLTALLILVLLLLAVLLLLLVVLWPYLAGRPAPVQPTPVPPAPPPGPLHKIPDHFDEAMLSTTLGIRLAGTPADGSLAPSGSAASSGKVIWVDGGDEVLVHLDSTQVRLLDRALIVSVDLETDQTGRTPLVVAFALGNAGDPAGLVATTDELPRGNGQLAARWGRALQAAVWSMLLGISQDHALERGKAPQGISVSAGRLSFKAGDPLHAASILGGQA